MRKAANTLKRDRAQAPLGSAPRREAFTDWRRRSRLVNRARRLLPLAIGAVLLGLLGAVITATLLGRGGDEVTDQTAIRMLNPRFLGRDKDNQAFELQAKEAARTVGAANRIRLTAPVMTLNRDGPTPTRVVSERGVYDETSEVAHLQGKVVMDGAAGRFVTEEAIIDSNAQSVRGSAPIQGVGPTGRIAADAYHLYDGGARVTFTGRVRARLEQGAAAPPVPQGETP